MKIEKELIPEWINDTAPVGMTRLRLTLDVSSILDTLTRLDLYVVVNLSLFHTASRQCCQYEYTKLFRTVTTPEISFTVNVFGNFTSTQDIKGKATGYFIMK